MLTFLRDRLYFVLVMLTIGTAAPTFAVPLVSGGEFDLSDHRGKIVVVYFFLRAFTHG